MSKGHYCDNVLCPQYKMADAPGPVDYLSDGGLIRVSRHRVKTDMGEDADLCGVCHSAIELVCIDRE